MSNGSWLIELNDKLFQEWERIATYLEIEPVDKDKIKSNKGQQIIAISDWMKSKGRSVPDSFREILIHFESFGNDKLLDLNLKTGDYSESSVFPNAPQNNVSVERSMMKPREFYATFGGPSVGKSVLVNLIMRNFPKLSCHESNVINQKNSLNTYLEELFLRHKHEYFFRFQTLSFALRARNAFQENCDIFHEESIFDSLAYAIALNNLHLTKSLKFNGKPGKWLNTNEYNCFKDAFYSLEHYMPKPTKLIHLHCNNIDLIMDKIKTKNQPVDSKFPRVYVEALIHAYNILSCMIQTDNELSSKVVYG